MTFYDEKTTTEMKQPGWQGLLARARHWFLKDPTSATLQDVARVVIDVEEQLAALRAARGLGDAPIVGVREADLQRILRQRDEYALALKDAQVRMGEIIEATLHRTVRAFHHKFGHPVATTPKVPDVDQVAFRLALITEEYLELLDACGIDEDVLTVDSGYGSGSVNAAEVLRQCVANNQRTVDLPAVVDALADLDYVCEGTRAVFGVDGRPIAEDVHKRNMEKQPVLDALGKPVPHSKPTKPETWKPSDTRALLLEQGWQQ